jgi:hypothetical protein
MFRARFRRIGCIRRPSKLIYGAAAIDTEMVERKTLLAVLLIVALASASGYAVGRFSTPGDRLKTIISTVATTQTTTSSTTMTVTGIRTVTHTTTAIKESPSRLPLPTSSSAIIKRHLLFNEDILVLLSIDKQVYQLGETVQIRATATNLTPNSITFPLDQNLLKVVNGTGRTVWVLPERSFVGGLGFPPPSDEPMSLAPGETKRIGRWSSADWNMTGIRPPPWLPGETLYEDHVVPEGEYTVVWQIEVYYSEPTGVSDEIPFTITK